MQAKYKITKDLETGNQLIDTQHVQLFDAVNNLLDACSQGKGRERVVSTVNFLENYDRKHFNDEEGLQVRYHYPGYEGHRQFHERYKNELSLLIRKISQDGADMRAITQLNQEIAVLISHIRLEDKRLAEFIRNSK